MTEVRRHALRRSAGGVVWAVDQASHGDTASLLQERLGNDTYEDLTRQGAALPLGDLLDVAAAV